MAGFNGIATVRVKPLCVFADADADNGDDDPAIPNPELDELACRRDLERETVSGFAVVEWAAASAAGVALDLLLTKAGPFVALGKTDAERDEPNAGPVDPGRPVAGVVGVAPVLVASASAAAAPARATAVSKDSNSCTLGVAARIMTICSSNARNQSPRYTAVGDTRARFTGLISAPWSPPGALIKACAVVAAWTDTRAASRFWRAE
jgi:hypothetical protein